MPPTPSPSPSRRGAFVAFGLWLLGVGAGLGLLLAYSHAPGGAGSTPERWPAPAELALDAEHPTLLLFAHPRCPCTRASLHELQRLVADVGGRLRGRVLFVRPPSAEAGWERTDLWRLAESIPGLEPAVDDGGLLARRFGATTSGHAVVYDPAGALVFSGGLTSARAHEGDNRGRDAVRHFVEQGTVVERETPVYGCALFDAELAPPPPTVPPTSPPAAPSAVES